MKNQKSANFYTGAKVQAIYRPTGIPDYDGNPLIEALPPIMTSSQAAKRLVHFPKYDDSMRHLDNSTRYHLLRTSSRFFTPLGIHIDLERRISCALRESLLQRNPTNKEYLLGIEEKADKLLSDWDDQYNIQNDYISTYAPGFNLVGISGSGKSQSIQRNLGIYPQVIFHNNYNGHELIETQLVWLKLDCPFDGSIKALCLNFFQAVDSILGTDYFKAHATGTTTQMLPRIATVAANHHLGIFVIDEIQRLNQASSGGKDEMLNFFVQLVNTIGVSVVLVGTFKALEMFEGSFSQMRRGTGQGDLVWDRMSFDKNWDRFVSSLWKYQFTRRICSLENNPDLSRVLYDECQGITDLAIKAYMFSQERAIELNKDLNATIIRSATRDKFQIIRPAIEAFRKKDKGAAKIFEDAYPELLEKYMPKYSDWTSDKHSPIPIITKLEVTGEITNEPEIQALISDKTLFDDSNNRQSKSKGVKKNTKPKSKGVLPSVVENSDIQTNNSFYKALNDSGFIAMDDLGFTSSNSKLEDKNL